MRCKFWLGLNMEALVYMLNSETSKLDKKIVLCFFKTLYTLSTHSICFSVCI